MSDFAAAFLETEIDGQVCRFPLDGDRILRIGRSDKNNIVLSDDLASRHHAMLQQSEEGPVYITDCGSSNGTFVNGTRIAAPVILRDGDNLRIGNREFGFHQEAAVESAPPAETAELQSTNVLFAQALITVLVVDIRDFTGLARRVEAAKLLRVTRTLFREAGRVLAERSAWAQKYIGDAVMAVWLHKKRAPELRELAAIFDGLAGLAQIAGGLQAEFQLDAPIRIGAGINSGWASVGNVGSIASSDYTALGDVVNKAFRLESATKDMACDLALGQDAYDFLASSAEVGGFFRTSVVKLKGYDEPSVAYGVRWSSLQALLDALHRSVEAS
ncbi:MAG: adenylate/guanylate cyclase domain-containing protein [Acidobacteriia bacterium]|nr:adenylate/guanylate cyclase domain-containing protein [Terriglobia bacterium]